MNNAEMIKAQSSFVITSHGIQVEKRLEYVLNDPPMGAEHYKHIHKQNIVCFAVRWLANAFYNIYAYTGYSSVCQANNKHVFIQYIVCVAIACQPHHHHCHRHRPRCRLFCPFHFFFLVVVCRTHLG